MRSSYEVEGPHTCKEWQRLGEGFVHRLLIREFLAKPNAISAGMGSFDCVFVRYANENFAQDDMR
jgi:hypothetical protein